MASIVHALTPVYNKVQTKSRHENSLGGVDATSWPVPIFTPDDPYAITVGHLYNWSESWVDDKGGMIVKRGSVHFDLGQAFSNYTRVTGKPAPASYRITRATISFMYNSLGMSWEAGGEVGSTKRFGSQLNRLFYTTGDAPFSPTQANPIAAVPPFDAFRQRVPATVKTTELEHLPVDPAPPASSRPRISVPLVFATKPGGYFYKVDPSSRVDGSYWVDLTNRLASHRKFGIVLAGHPDGELTSDPDRSFMDFGAAVYYNFFLNVKIEF